MRSCEATVTGVELLKGSKAYVELDRTIFHPLGGGQPSDEGSIVSPRGAFAVKKAIRDRGRIRHWGRIEAGSLEVGDTVRCELNWEKRYLVMRLHTAGHILDYAMLRLYGRLVETLDAFHGPPEAYLVYSVSEPPDAYRLEEEANKVVERGLSVAVKFVPRGELQAHIYNAPNVSRLPPSEEYRVVEIPGVNAMPCTGTHVSNTREVGRIKVLGVEREVVGVKVRYTVV
ncbi:alanyl-tRNA editing protein [Thermofilum pendens]|uniref:alanyl-tRNA editing protein n=1 Tax=Thermofilum pendens TaxID=2269 RepID=UPI001CA4AF9F|nr:alanyl-tRNA editing protein [Thermofilum pendens]